MGRAEQSFDICILCALYEEASAVIDEFTTRCNVTFTRAFRGVNRLEYAYATIQNQRGEPLSLFVTWLTRMGPVRTALDLKPLLQEINPRFVAMTGLCAGYRRTTRLGDLIVATSAYLLEEGKVIVEADGRLLHLPEIEIASATSQVIHFVQGFEAWREPLRELKRQYLTRAWRASDEPRCQIGVMASSMAVRADSPFPVLTTRYHRKTIGMDMEAATFYAALRDFPHIHGLVVKGVSDYGDTHKTDRHRDYARRASAIYLLHLIQQYVMAETMPRNNEDNQADPYHIWNVPYQRNIHFTGRDELFEQLDQQLSLEVVHHLPVNPRVALTQPQAIKGLGGIGKTQIAVEYAYRAREQRRYTHILWVNAVNEEAIIASFVAIAELLPASLAKHEPDQHKLLLAVKRWLELCQQNWLLIFDNADDITLLQEYLPQMGNGCVLFTTRAAAVGSLARAIEVEKMGFLEGTHLLLRRAQRFEHATDEEINAAGNIVVTLDHFPLALDQAGAYIEETQCSFSEYLALYQEHRKALLSRRGKQSTHYPDSVSTTWSLSFRKVEQANPAAVELLRLCAFLAPDYIPEELFKESAAYWPLLLQQSVTDPFAFNQLLEELLKFSLIKRLTEGHFLSIHRLVQAVQVDTMTLVEQQEWASSIVRALNVHFPQDVRNADVWSQCLRYLEQVQACSALIQRYAFVFPEAADLLDRTGTYLRERGSYSLAESLYQKALAIREQQPEVDNLDIAASLNNLGVLSYLQGMFAEARLYHQRALNIREQQLGPDHPDVASSLNNLGILYYQQGKFDEAEPLYQRALHIREQQSGLDHPRTANALNNLALLYREWGKYAEAEALYQRVLHIREQQSGSDHPEVADLLNNLANLYYTEGKHAEAEALYQRVLHIREQQLGSGHPEVADALSNLASLYNDRGRATKAEPLYQRALHIYEQYVEYQHPKVAYPLCGLADLYSSQRRYNEARPLYERALYIWEQQEHPNVAYALTGLAELYGEEGEYEKAESFYVRALHIREQHLGLTHPLVASPLTGLGNLYVMQKKYTEAEPFYQRALAIREQALDSLHPHTAETLYGFARLREAQGQCMEAIALYRRALKIRSRFFGSQHPYTNEVRKSLKTALQTLNQAIQQPDLK